VSDYTISGTAGYTSLSTAGGATATISLLPQSFKFGSTDYTSLTLYEDGYIYFGSASMRVYNTNMMICFDKGTKILCLNKQFEEEYIPIENLKKGDLVKSYKHGYRKIYSIGNNFMINNPNQFNACMYKLEKTEDNKLTDDLIVTGGHSVLVDSLGIYEEETRKIMNGLQMIDDKYLLLSSLSKDFIKLDNNDSYNYYHFILENNDSYNYYHFILENNDDENERFSVWANGILTETPNKKTFINSDLIIKL
jgi:hypothetical protein